MKIVHFYWGGDKISYLRYLSIYTFALNNKGWEIVIHYPSKVFHGENTWSTGEQTNEHNYEDWWFQLTQISGIRLHCIDFDKIGFSNDLPEVFKSDYAQLYYLNDWGGLWSDTDIIFFNPIDYAELYEADFMVVAEGNIFYPALMYSKKGCPVMKHLLKDLPKAFNKKDYQCLGSKLFKMRYGHSSNLPKVHSGLKIILKETSIILPVKYIRDIDSIHAKAKIDLTNSIGLHWFGGHPKSGEFENLIQSEHDLYDHQTNLCKVILEVLP